MDIGPRSWVHGYHFDDSNVFVWSINGILRTDKLVTESLYMNKSLFLWIMIGIIHCTNPEPKSTKQHDRPNIIIFFVDDLGKEWISCYGAEDIRTPHIDQIAEQGVLFHHVYGMPQCTPSRVTLLTGQYPFRHGWVNHWDVPRWGGGAHFDESLNPSLPAGMKKAGYKTCIAGKWQIDDFRVEPDALTRCGFDEFCMWTGGEGGNPPSNERYQNPYIFTKEGSRTYAESFGPDIFKDFIINFIHNNKDTSMFIYYPMVLTHGPLVNTPKSSETTKIGKFKAMVEYTDRITGEIVEALEDTGIRERTLIIWTTDNGTSRGITGTRNGRKIAGGKSQTNEAGICLPFLVSWPGMIDARQESRALIDFTDIMPTCLDLAGLDIGSEYQLGNRRHRLDGVSFKDVLVNNGPGKRRWILAMGGGNHARRTENGVENQYRFRDRVLRNERFKLTINSEKEASGFYDLMLDPEEINNLIDSLDSGNRMENFNALHQVLSGFPDQDLDPQYMPNPSQSWDVTITAESQVWKK